VVQGADSKGNKITWINFHPDPSSCPLNVLSYVQPPCTACGTVDDLVDVLGSKRVKAQLKHVVSEMEKVPTPAAPDATSSGIAAPTCAECVVTGQLAHADWDFLFQAANAKAKSVRDKAEKDSLHWLKMGSNRQPGATATTTTFSPCRFLEEDKKQIDTARTSKSCALKPKF
jgi:hypothetical protein